MSNVNLQSGGEDLGMKESRGQNTAYVVVNAGKNPGVLMRQESNRKTRKMHERSF